MRKIIFALVLLMLAAPASAEVLITTAQVGAEPNVIVSFVNSEGQHVRAFALDIVVESSQDPELVISAVECLSDDYYVYPGSIQITDNEVTNEGSCLCDDSYDDTLPGLDSNGVTIEMASLYSVNDVDHNVPPADSGDLVKLTLSGCGTDVTITVTANELRGKVVMEDASLEDPNAPGGAAVLAACTCISPDDQPLYDNWVAAGEPNCWCPEHECHGLGDTDGDCDVDTGDITVLLAGWAVYMNGVCGDTDRDGDVDTGDVTNALNGWNDGCGACTPVAP
jgi:hypothetical protein